MTNSTQSTPDTVQSQAIKALRNKLASKLAAKKSNAFDNVNLLACPELPSW